MPGMGVEVEDCGGKWSQMPCALCDMLCTNATHVWTRACVFSNNQKETAEIFHDLSTYRYSSSARKSLCLALCTAHIALSTAAAVSHSHRLV